MTPLPRARSLSSSALWLIIAKTVGFAFTVALPLLLVRRLTLLEFGNYKQYFVILQSAATILPLGLQMSTFYFLPRANTLEDKKQIIFSILVYYAVISGLASLALWMYPNLITSLVNNPELGQSGRLISIALWLYVLSTLYETFSMAHGEPGLSATVIVISNLLRTSLILAAAYGWGTIRAIITATIVVSLLQVGAMFYYLSARFPFFWTVFNWVRLKNQLSYAVPLGVAGLAWALQMDVHNYFVSHHFGPTAFAIYSTGCFQLPLVAILSDSVGAVLIPRVSLLQQGASNNEILSLTRKTMRLLALIYIPTYCFLTIMAHEFITLLFTNRFAKSIPIFQINLLLIPLSLFMLDPIMRAHREQRYWLLRLNLVLVALEVGLLWVLVPRAALFASIMIVVAIQYIGRLITCWHISVNVMRVSLSELVPVKPIGAIAVAACAAGLFTSLVRFTMVLSPLLMLLLGSVVFLPVYLLFIVLLKVLTPDETLNIRRRLAKVSQLATRVC